MMAYLHCHNCNFSQDDFWDFRLGKYGYFWHWGYNPFSVFLMYVFGRHGFIKPHRIEFDRNVMAESGWKRRDPHSWWLIWLRVRNLIRTFKRQRWWTYNSFQTSCKIRNGAWPPCPECGKRKLDID